MCEAQNVHYLINEAKSVFGNNTDIVEADLYKGGIFLGCSFGMFALYVWAVGILAAGQSSTMTGTYAGQFAMEGFLNLQWARWKRVLVTRMIAIVPTFCVAYFSDIQDLTGMNDILNAVMTLQLPFAVIPTITFTSSVAIMGEFVNGVATKIVSILLSIVVIAINITFVVDRVNEMQLEWGWLLLVSEYWSLFYYLFYHIFHSYRPFVNSFDYFIFSNFRYLLPFVQLLSGYSHGGFHGKSTDFKLFSKLSELFVGSMF